MFWEEDDRGQVPFSSHHVKDAYLYQYDTSPFIFTWITWLEVVFVRFLYWELLFHWLLSTLYSLEERNYVKPHPELCFLLPEYPLTLCGILLHKNLSIFLMYLSSHIYVYVCIYICVCVCVCIYIHTFLCILCVYKYTYLCIHI